MGKRAPEPMGVTAPCRFCGGASHQVDEVGGQNASFIFMVEYPLSPSGPTLADQFTESEAGALLRKIREAMKLGPQEVSVWIRSSGGASLESASCMPFQMKELKSRAPRVVITFGEGMAQSLLDAKEPLSELRGRFHTCFDLKILATEDLTGMLTHPALKKQAWEDLKLALQG